MSFGDSTDSTVWQIGTGSFGGATSAGYTVSYTMPSETSVRVALGRKEGAKEISANLYLRFVKSKLGKVHQERVKRRLVKLQDLVTYSKEMGQRALYESLCEEIAVLVRESEMVSFGITQWVDFKDIDKFRGMVKEKVIKWEPLEKFPRVVPKEVATKIKQLEKASIFDELWVLFIDYTKQDLKTTKEKIRNKDPILFGKFTHQPNRYYYIADWVDEYCDLTLDKFVEKFKLDDPTYGVNRVTPVNEERWKGIVDEVKARHKRLEDTKMSNWRELEKEEANAETTKLKEELSESLKVKDAPEILKGTVLEVGGDIDKSNPKRKWYKLWLA